MKKCKSCVNWKEKETDLEASNDEIISILRRTIGSKMWLDQLLFEQFGVIITEIIPVALEFFRHWFKTLMPLEEKGE